MTSDFNLPLCLFPSAHWLIMASPLARINPNEIYLKQTSRNRYDIAGVNGRLSLTVPVEGQKGVKTPFKEIRILDNGWRKQHISTLRSAYGRAAYFEHYFDRLESVILKPNGFLLDLNLSALEWIVQCGIELEYVVVDEEWSYRSGDNTYLWEPAQTWPELPSYPQVFSDRHAFMSGLSCIDLLMNKGPRTNEYLAQVLNR
ncbi:MAG: WbqC family protein [Flavobacteriales bacterium]